MPGFDEDESTWHRQREMDACVQHKSWRSFRRFGNTIFVGDFDGHKFTCESKPEVTKWMDYGKDHYATVTFDNAPNGRHVALAWMSNWQYANQVPTLQYRSANSIPRDLGLFEYKGNTYCSVTPSEEITAARSKNHQSL